MTQQHNQSQRQGPQRSPRPAPAGGQGDLFGTAHQPSSPQAQDRAWVEAIRGASTVEDNLERRGERRGDRRARISRDDNGPPAPASQDRAGRHSEDL